MPNRSEKVTRLNEETGQYELPYISKSRVMQWLKNPEHFRLKYLEGVAEPETEAMVRGTRIHESIENFYHTVVEQGNADDAIQNPGRSFGNDRQLWADFIEPYLSNFIVWENKRRGAVSAVEDYSPVGIEEEVWRDGVLGIDGEPEWMGIADAVLPASSIPECDSDDGVVIVDFKTGKVPKEKYRAEGIYTELQYYIIVFEETYDIAGAGAYYPKENEFLLKPPGGPYRDTVLREAEDLIRTTSAYEGDTKFETKPGPLCKWGEEDDEESAFYGVCSQCSWGAPVNNKNTFEAMVEEGYSMEEIAEELDTTTNAVGYWKYKLDL